MNRRLAAPYLLREFGLQDLGVRRNVIEGMYERVNEQDLKQNAIVMAWFAWQAANTDQVIPRPTPAASGR
jgi:hypothetical protein